MFDPKDPDDKDDFTWDWSERLNAGESLSSAAFAVAAGDVVIDASGATSTDATVRLSGGTVGTRASVRCRVTTSAGRQLDHTEAFYVATR